jgi:cathepsin L
MKDVQPQPQLRQNPGPLPTFPKARGCVDWRNEGIVTPAGRQNKCGSCYAWSGAAALEGQLKKCGIFNGSISTQLMVDCQTVGVYGCSSGWPL